MALLTVALRAGFFTRKSIRRALEQYAWTHGYSVDFAQDKGVIRPMLRISFKLPADNIDAARNELTAWLRDIGIEVGDGWKARP
jgi:hypothetical protein